jgi:hypothetical protein
MIRQVLSSSFVACALLFGAVGCDGVSSAAPPSTYSVSDDLVAALIQVESGGDDDAVGDRRLAHHAYGCLQIRQPVCDDVNQRFGTNYQAEQCLGNRELSIGICRLYIGAYATAERLGHEPNDENRARIWNGGPTGWRRAATKKYWDKVQAAIEQTSP